MAERPTMNNRSIQGEEFTSRIPTRSTKAVTIHVSAGRRARDHSSCLDGEQDSNERPRRIPRFIAIYRFPDDIGSLPSRHASFGLEPLLFDLQVTPLSLKDGGASALPDHSGDLVRGLDSFDAMDRGYAIGGTSEEPSLTVRRRVTGRTVITITIPCTIAE